MYKLLLLGGISLITFRKWTEKAPETAPEKLPETGKMLLNRPPARRRRQFPSIDLRGFAAGKIDLRTTALQFFQEPQVLK